MLDLGELQHRNQQIKVEINDNRQRHSPKWKPSVLISALLQITIETDDTTDKLNAPTVPNWNF